MLMDEQPLSTVRRPMEDVAMTIDHRLARKGKGQPRQALLQQARILHALAVEHKEALADHGWDTNDTTKLKDDTTALELMLGGRAEVANEADQSTKAEHAALDAVKVYLRRLRLALPRVLRDNSLGFSMETFAVSDGLRRSTPKIIAYLARIRPAVEALDGVLTKHFGGKKASEELDLVKAGLEKADTDQEAAVASGPVETQALYEAMGRLLEDIEDVIRAGKSAFDGEAVVAAQFNKDLILRARGRKKDAPAEPVTTPATPV